MMPRAGTMHISTRMEFCVAKDCTAFGTYPVNSNTNPIAKAVKAAVSFTINAVSYTHLCVLNKDNDTIRYEVYSERCI